MDAIDLRNNLLTFITAGHETTALALTWTFYLLSLHPEVERRVRQEIDSVLAVPRSMRSILMHSPIRDG